MIQLLSRLLLHSNYIQYVLRGQFTSSPKYFPLLPVVLFIHLERAAPSSAFTLAIDANNDARLERRAWLSEPPFQHANTAETKYGPESAKKQVAVWRKAAFRRHSFADGASLPCEAAVYRLRPRHIPERIQISLWNFTHWCCTLPYNRATAPEWHTPSESTKTPQQINSISFILSKVVNNNNNNKKSYWPDATQMNIAWYGIKERFRSISTTTSWTASK